MSEQPGGRPTIVAGLLISLGVVVGAFLVSSALDRASLQIERVSEVLADEPKPRNPSARGAERPRRPGAPDPDDRYEVEIGDAPTLGDEDADVTIVEWSDFQCPFCNRVLPTLEQIKREYGDDVRLVFKHLPLAIHPQAPAAHAAAEAAHRQGRFWEMHDRIFASQRDLKPETFERYAEEIGLDMKRFRRDVASRDVRDRIEADKRQASELGVSGTPAFFVNGRFISGAQPFFSFKRVIDEALEERS